jgi:hypothetical protein
MKNPFYLTTFMPFCLAIAGCNSTGDNNFNSQASSATTAPVYESLVDRELGKCNKLIKDGKFSRSNAVRYHKCVITAKEKDPRNYLAEDKVEDYKRLELAEQFAANKISDTQFNSRMAEYSLERQRAEAVVQNQRQFLQYQRETALAAQQSAEAAQQAQALNAYLGASALMRQNTYQPVYTPIQPIQPLAPRIRAPITTNCNSFGNTTNCSSY